MAQDMAWFWFRAAGGHCAQIVGFFLGGLLGAARGHIVKLEGPKGPYSTGKSSGMCRVATIFLHFVVFSRF